MPWLLLLLYLLATYLIYTIIRYFEPENGLKTLVISATVVISLFSLIFFISLTTNLPYWSLILAILAGLLGIIYHLHKKGGGLYPANINYRDWMFFNLIIILGFWKYKEAISLSGRWDAWAFWNPHAKFLASDNWRELFNPIIDHIHSDYPLMLPATIAGFWKYSTDTPLVPILFSFVIFYLLLAGLYAFIDNRAVGLAIVAYLVYRAVFYNETFSQYADTLQAFYFLISVGAFTYFKDKDKHLMLVAGFLTFSNMWIKNEGIAFTVIFVILSFVFYFRNHPRQFKYFMAGGLLPLIITIFFKIYYAPTNDITGSIDKTITQLFDYKRLVIILKFLWKTIYNFFPLILVLIIMLFYKQKYHFNNKTGFGVLTAMFGTYIFIYMITPAGLNWHLSTSAIRLILQLFPLFIYLVVNEILPKHTT